MDDYIKREDAIEIIAKHDDTDGTIKVFSGRFVNGLISAIPPADVRENVRGEWVEEYDDDAAIFFKRRWVCSACGDYQTYGKPKFCPNCGADMRREDNGRDEENHNRV